MRMDVDNDMNSRGGFGLPQTSAEPERPISPRRHRTVLVLHVEFKFSMEHAKADVLRINKALGKIKRHAVLHGDRQAGWVLETHFRAQQIVDLIKPVTAVDSSVSSARVWTPGADIAATMSPDPLVERVSGAWAGVRDWNSRLGRLPPETFAVARPMADGRGEVATRILDNHPLHVTRPRTAA